MQVILVESDKAISDIITLNLSAKLNVDVILKEDSESVIQLLEILPSIGLIITRDQIGDEPTAINIINYLQDSEVMTPVIVMGKLEGSFDNAISVSDPGDWKAIISRAAQAMGITPESLAKIIIPDYLPISAKYFLNITHLNLGCEVYIRIKKGDQFQYIKRIKTGDNFDRKDIERYMASGLKYFYILREHQFNFVNFVTAQLVAKLEKPEMTGTERHEVAADTFILTQERIHTIGIDDNTVELANASINSMSKSVEMDFDLKDFVQMLLNKKSSYMYCHSYLILLLMNKCIQSIEWDTAGIQKDKLAFIAFFHDVALRTDQQAKIKSMNELKNSLNFTDEEKELIMNHAAKAAILLENYPRSPMGAASIIKEHHGVKTGIGFTDSFTNNISPLAILFIVVEHFVQEFIENAENPKADIAVIFDRATRPFANPSFSKVVNALSKVVLEQHILRI